MALERRKAIGFGIANLLTCALVALGVGSLPTRWWGVDVPAAAVAALLAASGLGLVRNTRWAERVARIAALASLGVGLVLLGLLALSASFLAGIYGPVGRGGITIMILVGALAFPYLVALPAAQLVWLGPRRRALPSSASNASKDASK